VLLEPKPYRFTQPAFDPIPFDRFSDPPAYNKAKSTMCSIIR
jgi:hypothetical protein